MTDRIPLIELAQISYEEYLSSSQEQIDEQHEQQAEDFLKGARATAARLLGAGSAEELEWLYTSPDDLPDDVEEATALLAKGRMDWLRFRYDHAAERGAFELVKQCSACGHEEAHEVTGLVRLGELLAGKDGDR